MAEEATPVGTKEVAGVGHWPEAAEAHGLELAVIKRPEAGKVRELPARR